MAIPYRGRPTKVRRAAHARQIPALRLGIFRRSGILHVPVLVAVVIAACISTLRAQVSTGVYTGNATDDRTISGVGFQPDLVIVKANAAQQAVARSSTMASGDSKVLGSSTAVGTNMIKALSSDGFTLGTSAAVNGSATSYYYLALRSVPGRMAVGSYVGDNGSSKSITGLGFHPEVVILMSAGANAAALRVSAMSASHFFQGGTATTIITSLDSNGFTVGTHGSANANNTTYHWVALRSGADFLVSGSYTGNGADNRSIVSGFRPDYLLIANGNNYPTVHRTDQVTGDATIQFRATANTANQIQAYESSGFQVGSDNSTNRNGVSYFYLAFTKYAIFESRQNGPWDQSSTWRLISGSDADTIPDGNDSLLILAPHTVDLRRNEGELGMGINGTLDAETWSVGGSGDATMNAGSTLRTRLATGVNGTLQLTGAKLLSTASNFVFEGSAAQYTGTDMPLAVNDLTVANSAGVSLSQSVAVNGTLGLSSGALTIGANTLSINGDITTTGGSLSGSGAASAIVIGGSVVGTTLPAVTCSSLTMNRAVGISLGGAVDVHGTLTMSSGNVTTGSSVLTLGASTSSCGTLARTDGTVVGYFRRWLAASPASGIIFPVGTATHYRPPTLSFTGAPSSGGTVTASFWPIVPGQNGLPLSDAGTMILHVSPEGYWMLDAADGLGGGTYTLELQATGFGEVRNPEKLRIVKRSGSAADWTLDGTHSNGGGTSSIPIARRSGMSGFSQFGIAGDVDNPLPIELAWFEARGARGRAELTWRTASEVDNLGFEVQRATGDGEAYIAIANYVSDEALRGLGTSALGAEYRYIDGADEALSAGRYTYRLVDIALDGARTTHSPITVEVAPLFAQVATAYAGPTPSSGPIDVHVALLEPRAVRVELVDAVGAHAAIVLDDELDAGDHVLTLPVAALPTGAYWVLVHVDGRAIRLPVHLVR